MELSWRGISEALGLRFDPSGHLTADSLLQESGGGKIILEDGSGNLILETGVPAQKKRGGLLLLRVGS